MKSSSFFFRMNRQTISITSTVCLLCCFPQGGFCASIGIDQIAIDLANFSVNSSIDRTKDQDWNPEYYQPQDQFRPSIPDVDPKDLETKQSSDIEKSLNDLTETICNAEDPLATTKQFLNSFLDQMNLQNKTSITIDEAYCLVRQNMDLIPMEYRSCFLEAVDVIEHEDIMLSIEDNLTPGKNFLLALAIVAITVVCVLNPEAIPAASKVILDIIEIIIKS